MAQGEVEPLPKLNGSLSFSEAEIAQIQKYTEILKFRDAVTSGAHPRIKVPTHMLAGTQTSPQISQPATTSNSSVQPRQDASKPPLHAPNQQQLSSAARNAIMTSQSPLASAAAPVPSKLPGLGFLPPGSKCASKTPASNGVRSSSKAEIDPIFLEKSDGLIKAEIQLQRQRIERTLRDQFEAHRHASKALQSSDALPDFDLVDVLQKALVLVQSTAPASTTNADVAAHKSDASDSFDDNTFYSSKFGSPSSRMQIESEAGDIEMQESSDYEPELDPETIAHTTKTAAPPSSNVIPPPAGLDSRIAGVSSQMTGAGGDRVGAAPPNASLIQVNSSGESGDVSRSGDSGPTDNEYSADEVALRRVDDRLASGNASRDSPRVMYAHDVTLMAPQPAHVSSLATSRQISTMLQDTQPPQATPAQVVALRREPGANSSPDSSPQAAKGSEKRRGKKKRKVDRQAANDAAVYIKPEPRSPSPISSSMPHGRPAKRTRLSLRSAPESIYVDSPGPASNIVYDDHPQYLPRVRTEERGPIMYEQVGDHHYGQPRAQPRIVSGSAQERGYYDDRQATSPRYVEQRHSPSLYPVEYVPREVRNIRSVSHTVYDRPYGDATASYVEARDDRRMSARPVVDRDRSRSPQMRTMAPPPRSQPVRIIVDEYGREYIEPPRAQSSVLRQSVAPQAPPKEPEIIYQRVPASTRATSRLPEVYDEGGVIYRRASPGPAKRVVAQPEYGAVDYRTYREREYSARPQAVHDNDFVQLQPSSRRPGAEPPLEYVSRSASVRPREPIRYEVARGYPERMGSVRPEVPVREYATTSQPEIRREYATAMHAEPPREYAQHPVARAYSVHPEAQVIQRPYSVRPAEPAYYTRPVPGEAGVTYIERPRGTEPQGVPYQDLTGREAFR